MELGCIQCILQECTLLTSPRKQAHSNPSMLLSVMYSVRLFSCTLGRPCLEKVQVRSLAAHSSQ